MPSLREVSDARGAPIDLRRELALFLRSRREAITPAQVGLAQHGRRRTPGLRREEVALLADIGVAWYSKLEMGHDIKTSPATLLKIAQALRLGDVETDYIFALAEVAKPRSPGSYQGGVPEAAEHLIPNIHKVGAVLWDCYMTALRWNALGDAMFGLSGHDDPFERNAVIRLNRDAFRKPYYGDDHELLVRSLVGIFRKAYVTSEPTPLARRVYEAAREFPLFVKFWDEQFVAEGLFQANSGPLERNHPVVGRYAVIATNLQIFRREDLYLRIFAPADDASAQKFGQLEPLGTPSTRETPVP